MPYMDHMGHGVRLFHLVSFFWFSENLNSSKKVVRWKKDPCLIARTCRLQAWKQRGVASLVSQDVVNDSSVHTIRYLVQVLYTFF